MAERWSGELFAVAWGSIAHGLEQGRPLVPAAVEFPPPLREHRACFVTLERGGALRGCIGSLEASRQLVVDVAENAFAAAFRDPRFPPLGPEELAGLALHLSLLSALEPLEAASEADLLAQLSPGVHGLVLRQGSRLGTFLPAVWRDLPDPAEFLRALRRKGGIGGWTSELRAWRYTVEELHEPAA